ncbi:response regulator [Pseudorhodoferax sp. LjRoot39]|uniref:response regulator n=1 Tax=Pseudorhodoferax sp. LjRoot39 TaxID=3342328 RepID=UPI003ED04F7D
MKNLAADGAETLSTLETAKRLGLAVRSVQLMVDRGELTAWKTPGGHRRIARASVAQWMAQRDGTTGQAARPPDSVAAAPRAAAPTPTAAGRRRVLLIEDSVHFQRLVSLLVADAFADVELHVASDGITGLTMYGQLQPDVLIIDVLLPGIDGPTLIATLRSQPLFAQSRLIVITSLDEAERAPYAYALAGVPLVHKPRLALELPALLASALAGMGRPRE